MLRRTAVLTVLALAATAAPAQGADPAMWQSPSQNIACMQAEDWLRCDMRRLGNPRAPRPRSCEFDYGSAFGVTKNARRGRRLCVSDAVGGPGTPTVRYGRTWRRNGFTCRVRESGVRCTNPRGHGFELRIGRQRLF